MRSRTSSTIFVLATAAAGLTGLSGLTGCRGAISRETPVHLNPNMDQQRRFEGQEENLFFADGRAMRSPVPGTVAWGELREDDHFYRGRIGVEFADVLPMKVDKALIDRGQTRFDIFCAPCHDRAGAGQGLVARRGVKQGQGMMAPPDFHSGRLRSMPVGQIFDVISNGARGMPAYGRQIPAADRWAVAAWVRVLQASRAASIEHVPADIAEQKGWVHAAAQVAPAGDATKAGAK